MKTKVGMAAAPAAAAGSFSDLQRQDLETMIQRTPYRPNRDCTDDERMAKKCLKKNLRLQARLRTLLVRLEKSLERNDDRMVQTTRKDLKELVQDHPEWTEDDLSSFTSTCHSASSSCWSELYPGFASAQSMVHSISCRLNAALRTTVPPPYSRPKLRKRFHAQQTRNLLRNMTKATQTEACFDNQHALVGYTRKKFYRRTMLVIETLGRLVRNQSRGDCLFTNALSSVSWICSIGCGPGCDIVGALALLKSLSPRNAACTSGSCPDTSVLLLDWAIDQWSVNVLSTLEAIIVPEHVRSFQTGRCDVRCGLVDTAPGSAANSAVLDFLSPQYLREGGSSEAPACLFLVSYLLSETRGLWYTFFDDLIQLAAVGTLFWLSDPTPCELYVWLGRYHDHLDVVWIDSAMDRPDLQTVMKRFGPAIVLARKRT